MNTSRALPVSILFIVFFSLITSLAHGASPATTITQCSKISDTAQRLSCYDHLAQEQNQSSKPEYIQPEAAFLDSQLVVTPWVAEYTLSVRDFAKLIAQAEFDGGKKIKIHGWARDGDDYILNITMRSPLQLRFSPRITASQAIPMSLLRKVMIDGEPTNASQFVMVIAAMVPDK